MVDLTTANSTDAPYDWRTVLDKAPLLAFTVEFITRTGAAFVVLPQRVVERPSDG